MSSVPASPRDTWGSLIFPFAFSRLLIASARSSGAFDCHATNASREAAACLRAHPIGCVHIRGARVTVAEPLLLDRSSIGAVLGTFCVFCHAASHLRKTPRLEHQTRGPKP